MEACDKIFIFFREMDEILTFYLSCIGNHRGGLAVGKALASGYNIAAEIVEYLQKSGAC